MNKLMGFVGCFYSLFCTVFLLLFCCMEGNIELKAKPIWAIALIYILGVTAAMCCIEHAFPIKKVIRKKKSKR